MKLGLGLYKSLLTDANFKFAKQAGATHLVVQLVDYIKGGENPSLMRNYNDGWGVTENEGKLWSYEYLSSLKKQIESHGLTLEAIENFDPSHWYDILLDGPKRDRQMEDLKTIIRNVGKAGIPIMGYYFSLAGVWGWSPSESGRGGAKSVEFVLDNIDPDTPIPDGMVWNMIYNTDASTNTVSEVSREEIWQRYSYFLKEIIPVAEECGVMMAAHPDDPPVPKLRGTARLFYLTSEYEKLLGVVDSPSNGFELCMGTVQEMAGSDIYAMLDKYSRLNKIGYIHFRNVKGKVPHYREVFVDEGDIDMIKALGILKRNAYSGVLIPDHTPEMTCDAAWHAGMAYALGYMKGAMQALQIQS